MVDTSHKMQLRTSDTTPYGRKVLLVAHELQLIDKIEITQPIRGDLMQGMAPENPLGKMPTLITADGMLLYDSIVICEYLNDLVKGKIFPNVGPAKYHALRLHALADGMLEAALLRRIDPETNQRPKSMQWLPPLPPQSADFLALQWNKIQRALKVAEQEINGFGKEITIGVLSLANALGYLDFRFPKDDWRKDCQALSAWYKEFSKRPSFPATAPK